MVVDNRLFSDRSRHRLSIRGWALWSIPRSARCFLLLAETVAAALTITLLLTQSATHTDLIRVAILSVLAIGYAECAGRIERLKRYLGGGRKVFADQLGVWTFAAALTIPAGWAALLVLALYAQVLIQRHREQSGPWYRVVFTAFAAILAMLAASGVVSAVGGGEALHSTLRGPLAVVAALAVFAVVNCGLMLGAMWFTARPPSVRVILPDQDALGYEVATLVLGVFTAILMVNVPVLTPMTLVLAAYLHRSSLVNALHQSARIDAKTGLLNNAAWTEHARGALSRSARDDTPVTVLFCDLDRFKTVNDTHGHLMGDHVLATVGACLRRELRGYDGLGRFGGEEFLVILDGLDHSAAQLVADRLRHAISALRFEADLRVTMSIGVAHHGRQDGPDVLQSLLNRADAALLQAKTAGRDRVAVA